MNIFVKVSTIENESESTEARGGQGNGRLMSWDYGRTATLTMQDALLSDNSLAMLAGNSVTNSNVVIVNREVLTVVATAGTDGILGTADDTGHKVTLTETPNTGTVTVYKVSNGIMTEEVTTFTISGKDVTFASGVVHDEKVMVFYEYTSASGATQVTFSANAFPATYRVVGDTVVRGQDGIDRKMQFVIPKAKLQSNFSLTMDAENVSTFDFNLDILVEAGTNKLYDIIRLA